MNKIKFMTIILVMVASLVGCSMEEESGEVLENKPSAITSKTINLTMMQPETINPITNKNKSVGYIMNLIYDSLFTIDENYDTVPQLVEEYKIENDGMSINIKLKDIKFDDYVVISGNISKKCSINLYKYLVEKIKALCNNIVVDCSGDLLKSVLKLEPFLVKPNLKELEQFANSELKTDCDIK